MVLLLRLPGRALERGRAQAGVRGAGGSRQLAAGHELALEARAGSSAAGVLLRRPFKFCLLCMRACGLLCNALMSAITCDTVH